MYQFNTGQTLGITGRALGQLKKDNPDCAEETLS